ncbi:hypothetical protein [Nocardioides sediminis]|uniref:hypothetical protein n=1 Tax=Nocardioides sediminis TaxID=433648 RepID=UPI00131EF947|nr:hypothetical protein [Nocardioides sediminis]
MTHAERPDAGRPDDEDPASVAEGGEAGEADETVETVSPTEQEPDWVRRRRLDAAFGDGAHSQSLGDRWYRDQVPPHHG